ncbi:hypothetical protein U879_11720 [Defluviimonas sp. 20V17]|uniref:Flagellar hook-length control protein FliK n=1 Tax=Allgaiera indica TaxID=765699 RepID=A0AAN4ZXW8_9RHOB|nr:flagellar hook-length control protein FliK [Allgaiera indica]KDB03479.1 hypothetical protein U879_11720 [Defluviimonas sp. 20V17]GHD98136.1 hypothetical protein GCM10008024_00440 [Allgaiera indica]SDW53187.1 Flagellar hook-length control protein FliK [Allgaiera indica]
MIQPVNPVANLAPDGAADQPVGPRAQAFSDAFAAATATPPAGPDKAAKPVAPQPPQPSRSAPATKTPAGSAKAGPDTGVAASAATDAADPAAAGVAGAARSTQATGSSLQHMLQGRSREARHGGTASDLAVSDPAATRAAQHGSPRLPETATDKAPVESAALGHRTGLSGTEARGTRPKAPPIPAAPGAQDARHAPASQDTEPPGAQAATPAHRHKDARHGLPPTPPGVSQPLLMPGLSQQPQPAPQAHRFRPAAGSVTATAAIGQTASLGASAYRPVIAATSATAPTGTAETAPENRAQLLQSATALAGTGGGTARVTLHPASLGTVVVQVNVTPQGVTHVHMTAATQGGYQALAATAGHLAQHLSGSGLNVGSVQTFVSGGGQPGAPATPPQGAAAHGAPGGGIGGGAADGFAGARQQAGGGQGQGQPPPRDLSHDASPTAAPRPRSGPDETVKAYA